MRAAAALLIAGALLASVGCATLPACPAKGGPAWTRWTSTHFTLLTDLDADDARVALRDFEELRAGLLFAAWRRAPEPAGRVTVFVFRGAAERRVFVRGKYLAQFVSNPDLDVSFIVKDGTERDLTVTHGLTFLLERHFGLYGHAHWFDEGLAYYLDPLTLEPDGALTYGRIDPALYRAVAHGARLPFARLWQPAGEVSEERFHVTSWLAVHYLFNHEAARLTDFQRRLAQGQDGASAWRATFPDLTPEVMDDKLAGYVFEQGQYLTFKAQLEPVVYDVASRPVDDATVHALRALLFATMHPTSERPKAATVAAEVAEALRLDPLQALALYVDRVFLHEDEADVDVPKRLIARNPDEAIGWLLLARAHDALHDRAEAAEAWEEVRPRVIASEAPLDLVLLDAPAPVPVDVRVARPAN